MEEKELKKNNKKKVIGRVLCTKTKSSRLTEGNTYPIIGTRDKGNGLEFKILDDDERIWIFKPNNCDVANFKLLNFKLI